MSSFDNNTTFKKTSFLAGSNSEFINEFYADYITDPNSLPDSWRKFFDGLSENEKLIYDNIKGPSWSPKKKLKQIKFSNNVEEKDNKINLKNYGFIGLKNLDKDIPTENQYLLSSNGDLKEAAQQLYASFHVMDAKNYEAIFVELVPELELGRSINDRIRRALQKTKHKKSP